ncbi:hypothetical protein [Aliivibrio fischeri]|uniref:hypothetical protein n=1 Tax=Aliivibrio fischeri TaxID=668 RepID=UPI00080DC4DC|nr:hypothetical protein [Aliivibrio fischeri]OCH36199.1 hypothetical protein A6E02_19040 [Aliivibrio fischeri]
MARKHRYVITIEFSSEEKNSLFVGKVPYPFSKSYKDELTITDDKIEIVADRSNKVDIKGIFDNHNSALYTQIIKSLVYYYCCVGKANKITNIQTHYIYDTVIKDKLVVKSNDINQIVESGDDLSLLKKLEANELEVIFEESPKGHSYLIALTHLVKSFCSESPYDSFERKWKSFNALYRQVSNEDNEFKRQVFVRNHLINHPELYPLTFDVVSKLTATGIREKVRWVKFIHNNFATLKQTENFKNFVIANEDHRLAEINQSTLTVREKFLKDKGLYNDVEAHLNHHIEKKTLNNSHLTATLCIKYMYFVRNKSVHAEKVDSSFRLTSNTKEEVEVKWLSSLLDLLLIDLVNAHSNF